MFWTAVAKKLLVLNACLCSLNLSKKLLPVCPTYALLQSWHVNLYAPDCEYLSVTWCFGMSNFWMVLLIHSEFFKSVFLNRFVMNLVSLLKYVMEAHLCVVVPVCPSEVVVVGLWVGGLWVGGLCVCELGNCCLT